MQQRTLQGAKARSKNQGLAVPLYRSDKLPACLVEVGNRLEVVVSER